LEEQIFNQWPGMRERSLREMRPNSIPAATVQAASELVSAYFNLHQVNLEKTLWAGIRGSDARLVDAMRQLTAAKAILDAFVSLGLSRSLAGDSELQALFSGSALEKGKTRLLDQAVIEAIAAKGGSLLAVTRDPEWLDLPASNLRKRFEKLSTSDEPQALIETAMDRLTLLENMHQAAQPAMPLPDAARELKRKVLGLGEPKTTKSAKP
jgi:hypothetical protein